MADDGTLDLDAIVVQLRAATPTPWLLPAGDALAVLAEAVAGDAETTHHGQRIALAHRVLAALHIARNDALREAAQIAQAESDHPREAPAWHSAESASGYQSGYGTAASRIEQAISALLETP